MIELTLIGGTKIMINAHRIISVHDGDSYSVIYTTKEDSYEVNESYNDIKTMMKKLDIRIITMAQP